MPHCKLIPHKDKDGWRVDVGKTLSPTIAARDISSQRRSGPSNSSRASGGSTATSAPVRRFWTQRILLTAPRRLKSHECARKHQVSCPKLRDVALDWVSRYEESRKSVTVAQLFEEFMATQAGSSHKHRQSLQYTFERMEPLHGMKVCDLTKASVGECFQNLSDASFNAHVRRVRSLLSHAVKHGYAVSNVAALIGQRKRPRTSVQILPVSTVQLMLDVAQEALPSLLPFLVTSLFTGARTEEVFRLLWSDFNLPDRTLMVRREVSKTNRHRIINLSENTLAWLETFNRPGDCRVMANLTPAALVNAREKLWLMMRERDSSLPRLCPHNALRHLFVSMFLGAGHSIDSLLLQSGHTSAVMFQHYLSIVSRADAARYWSIAPRV